jgi:uncharacterized protein YdeI (YjbR/CyaY-like superfamily)
MAQEAPRGVTGPVVGVCQEGKRTARVSLPEVLEASGLRSTAARSSDDLKAALAASPIARKFFESLDSKNRYAILYRLHNAKKPETRERRLLKFVQMLKAGETLHERPGLREPAE